MVDPKEVVRQKWDPNGSSKRKKFRKGYGYIPYDQLVYKYGRNIHNLFINSHVYYVCSICIFSIMNTHITTYTFHTCFIN